MGFRRSAGEPPNASVTRLSGQFLNGGTGRSSGGRRQHPSVERRTSEHVEGRRPPGEFHG